jgi:ribosomal protein L37AE/L43A
MEVTQMLRLKSCPKCKGDVRIDRDQYGWYEQCLQCGHVRDMEPFTMDTSAPKEHHPWKDNNHLLVPIQPIGLDDFKREDKIA